MESASAPVAGMKTLDVLFTPADFDALRQRNLADAVCVVFDVFRATSSMITALANGATVIVPVGEIPDALAIRQRNPSVLLAGERDGVRILAPLTGGTDFDLGNSPREFTREKVAGRTIVMTTTNGTRALQACAHAKDVMIGSFLNLQATAERVRRSGAPNLVIVCSGTFEQAAYEDVLSAGALSDLLGKECAPAQVSDAALMARQLYQSAQHDLLAATSSSRNGRRLLSRGELRDDVAFCLQRDIHDFAAGLQADGTIRLLDR
jgi:2-phosphosulfolactate phosphatase